MARKEIGRNEPCPCGSGKKFKKCCYGKNISDEHNDSKTPEQILPSCEKIDYGIPKLNDTFFQKNHCHDISAPRLVYSALLSPGIEEMASKISSQFISRGHAEADRIRATENVNELLEILKSGPDSLNHVMLQKKLLKHKQESVPLIIQELKKPQRQSFFELSVRILHAAGNDCSSELIDIIRHHQRDGYAVSLLCMLLGFYDNEHSGKLLWDYFHYFKEKWPHDTLSDGPLLGLSEMKARKADKYGNITLH